MTGGRAGITIRVYTTAGNASNKVITLINSLFSDTGSHIACGGQVTMVTGRVGTYQPNLFTYGVFQQLCSAIDQDVCVFVDKVTTYPTVVRLTRTAGKCTVN